MCGIYGFSGKNFDAKNIAILALQNITRGEDSTGFYFESQKEYTHDKDIVTADVFLEKYIDRFRERKNSKNPEDKIQIFIGHNRAATVGVKTKENAHPFVVKKKESSKNLKDIVLVHNGTLREYFKLINKFDHLSHSEVKVDSQIFAYYLARYNDYEILKRFEGAAALMWKDINSSKLHVFRNLERPLHYGYINGDMYISSLDIPLKIIGCKGIKEFEDRIIYTIENGQIVEKSEKIPFTPFVETRAITTTTYSSSNEGTFYSRKDLEGKSNKFIAQLTKSLNNGKVKYIIDSGEWSTGFIRLEKSKIGGKLTASFDNLLMEILPENFIKGDFTKPLETIFFDRKENCFIKTTAYKAGKEVIYSIDQSIKVHKLPVKTNNSNNQNNTNTSTSNDNKNSEASEDDNIHARCYHCDSDSNNVHCSCDFEHKAIKLVSAKCKCEHCDNGWDNLLNTYCYHCEGTGYVTKEENENEELTEDQMNELTNSILLFKEIEEKYKEVLDKETLSEISKQVSLIEKVLQESPTE